LVNTLRSQDPEKLKAREQRFGTRKSEQQTGAAPASAAGGKKRRTATEEVDAEEQERRRKRAERFGIPVVVSQSTG
jgi:SAP domain-containing ribonucleoprotein